MGLRIIQFLRLFSIDIVFGTLASLLLSANILNSDIDGITYLVLGLVVFIIYSFDHLIDGIKSKGAGTKYSDVFFYEHRNFIILMLIVCVLISLTLIILFLPLGIIIPGLFFSLLMAVYFLLHFSNYLIVKKFFIKELWISFIYSIVIWGLAYFNSDRNPGLEEYILFLSFLIMILANVLIYSYYDYKTSDREVSMISGQLKKIRKLIYSSLLLAILLLGASMFFHGEILAVYFIMTGIALMLFISIRFDKVMSSNALYGIIADAAFLLPCILMFFD